MRCKDERIKMTNEVLNGIKVIKLYAWEKSMEQLIDNIRRREISLIRKASLLKAIVDTCNLASPFLVSIFAYISVGLLCGIILHIFDDCMKAIARMTLPIQSQSCSFQFFSWLYGTFQVAVLTFATYVLSDSSHILTPQKAFVSLTLFNQLRVPMTQIADLVSQTVQVMVSNQRLKAFLSAEELCQETIDKQPRVDGKRIFRSFRPNPLTRVHTPSKIRTMISILLATRSQWMFVDCH